MAGLRKMIDGESHDSTKDMIDKVGDVEEKKMQYDVAREKLRTHLLPTKAVMEHLHQRHQLDDENQMDPNGQMQPNQQMPGKGTQQQPGGQARPTPGGQAKMQPRNPGGPAARPNPAKGAGAKPAGEQKKSGKGIDIRVKASQNMERTLQLQGGGPGSGRHSEGGPTRTDVSRDAHRTRSIAIQDKMAKYEKLAKDGSDRKLLNDARQHHANAAREFAKGRNGTAHTFLTKSEGNLRAFEKFHKMI